MRFRGWGVVLAAPAAASLAFAPGAAAGPLTLTGKGRSVSDLQRFAVRAHAAHGARQARGDAHPHRAVADGHPAEHLRALVEDRRSPRAPHRRAASPSPTRSATSGSPDLGWVAASRAAGFLGALNGDFFGYQGWSGAAARGHAGASASIDGFGWGGPGVGFTTQALGGKPGGMVFGTPRAVPDTIALPGGAPGDDRRVRRDAARPPTLAQLPGDQVVVVTAAQRRAQAARRLDRRWSSAPRTPTAVPLRCCAVPGRGTTTRPTPRPRPTRPCVGFRFAETGVAARCANASDLARHAATTGVCPAGTKVTLPRRPGAARRPRRAVRGDAASRTAAADGRRVKVAVDPRVGRRQPTSWAASRSS